MAGRVTQQLHDIRHSLEKDIKDGNEEHILDLLCALETIPMTPALIKESKLGKVVALVKDKFDSSSSKVGGKSRSILVAWKKVMESTKAGNHSKGAIQHKTPGSPRTSIEPAPFDTSPLPQQQPLSQQHTESSSSSSSASFSSTRSNENATAMKQANAVMITGISNARIAMIKIFKRIFSDAVTSEVSAENLALRIEQALDSSIPSTTQSKAYTAKAKELNFNMKKNKVSLLHLLIAVGVIVNKALSKHILKSTTIVNKFTNLYSLLVVLLSKFSKRALLCTF